MIKQYPLLKTLFFLITTIVVFERGYVLLYEK